MQFVIADTFTDSLARLTGEEQKATKTTAFDLQMDPSRPGLQFHKLEKVRDKRFASVRVNEDIRLIVHRTDQSLLLCYVDHHDEAYRWAEHRKLETHPKTGAAQMVEIRETVEEIVIPRYVEVEQPSPPKPPLFAHVSDEDLLRYGVPPEWLTDVREATEDTLHVVAEHLPAEASDALLELAVGNTPDLAPPAPEGADPFAHPDAMRRFRTMQNVEELERALEYPWEKWTIFLHPDQRALVERDYNGPARVSGSAGTGKTVVALHRAAFLARSHPDARVLLTTFSTPLANALRTKLLRLLGNEPRVMERIEVHAAEEIARRLRASMPGSPPRLAAPQQVEAALAAAAAEVDGHHFTDRFLFSEWRDVVDAWQLETWEDYRDVRRLGRKTRLPESARAVLWSIFEKARAHLAAEGLTTAAGMLRDVASGVKARGGSPFDFVVVDESQDAGVPQLRFFAALGQDRPNSLFFAGDLGQRIFQQPFSWKSLGVDVRGRSRTLHVNYRTSHQIRQQADRLLAPEVSDVDGNVEDRSRTISVFNGPSPEVRVFDDAESESAAVAEWLKARIAEGVAPDELGVFVRSSAEMLRAVAAATAAGIPYSVLDERTEAAPDHISLGTMHLAKGLEFRAVAVMACDDEVIPSQERIETITDESDLEEVYNTERHLLYVACTRARDRLLVTGVDPASEFLDDLRL